MGGETLQVDGVHDIQAAIAQSDVAKACYVSKLVVQHGLGRKPRPVDKCLIDSATAELNRPQGNIRDMLYKVLVSDMAKFKQVNQ